MSRLFAFLFVCLAAGGAPALAEAQAASPAPLPSTAPGGAATPSAGPSSAPVPGASSPIIVNPTPEGSAAPTDQAVNVRALDWLRRLQTGDIDRTQLSIDLNARLTPERVKAISASFAVLGKFVNGTYLKTDVSHGLHGYYYEADFTKAKYLYVFEVDAKDDVAGLFLSPMK